MARASVTAFVALVRAVNVGGTGKIAMADLRALGEGLGFAAVATILQSGNLVFSAEGTAGALARSLGAAIEAAHGLQPDVAVRTARELDAAIGRNPFVAEAEADPAHLLVGFSASVPSPEAGRQVAAVKIVRERLILAGRELYAWYPDGIGRSKVTSAVLEKALGTPLTMRNWTTVRKIAAALSRL